MITDVKFSEGDRLMLDTLSPSFADDVDPETFCPPPPDYPQLWRQGEEAEAMKSEEAVKEIPVKVPDQVSPPTLLTVVVGGCKGQWQRVVMPSAAHLGTARPRESFIQGHV